MQEYDLAESELIAVHNTLSQLLPQESQCASEIQILLWGINKTRAALATHVHAKNSNTLVKASHETDTSFAKTLH